MSTECLQQDSAWWVLMNKERNHHRSAHECGHGEEVSLSERAEMPLLKARSISHGDFQVTLIMFVLLCGAPMALQAVSLLVAAVWSFRLCAWFCSYSFTLHFWLINEAQGCFCGVLSRCVPPCSSHGSSWEAYLSAGVWVNDEAVITVPIRKERINCIWRPCKEEFTHIILISCVFVASHSHQLGLPHQYHSYFPPFPFCRFSFTPSLHLLMISKQFSRFLIPQIISTVLLRIVEGHVLYPDV